MPGKMRGKKVVKKMRGGAVKAPMKKMRGGGAVKPPVKMMRGGMVKKKKK